MPHHPPHHHHSPTHPCIVFDVDGTLTGTTGVDDACLVSAWERVLGATNVDTDWSHYAHSTDDGLTLEVCHKTHGRAPTHAEVVQVQNIFFNLLRERIAANPTCCIPIPGAATLLSTLRAQHYRIGIASGAWEESARIKLAAAGLSDAVHNLPGTFSHPHPHPHDTDHVGAPLTREEIVTGTLAKLGRWSGGRNAPAVYIGDGVWDAKAAHALKIGFVGVRLDGREDRLRAQGANHVIRDYTDLPGLLRMIEEETA